MKIPALNLKECSNANHFKNKGRISGVIEIPSNSSHSAWYCQYPEEWQLTHQPSQFQEQLESL